jgi:hypothetical protein
MKTRALAASGLTAVLLGSGLFVSAMPASAQVGDQGGNGHVAEYQVAEYQVAEYQVAEYHVVGPAVGSHLAVEAQAAVPAVENQAASGLRGNQVAIQAVVHHTAVPAVEDRNNLLGGLAVMLLGGATLLRKRVTSIRE